MKDGRASFCTWRRVLNTTKTCSSIADTQSKAVAAVRQINPTTSTLWTEFISKHFK